MSRTVLGIVRLDGLPGQSSAFKRACETGKVSFRCETVSNIEEGLAYLAGAGDYADRKRYPMPALVVLDWEMDSVGGSADALRFIRSQSGLRYLPVVVVSDSRSQSEMKRAYDRGASSWLLKPKSLDALVELIRMIDRYWVTLNQTPGP